jgi:O-antigen/teichoic acid export membrane protein
VTQPSPTGGDLFWSDRRWWGRAGQTSIASWGATGLAFLATVIAARALGPSEFGGVVLAVSVTTLVSTFLDITLEEAVIYYGQQSLATGRIARLRALIRTSFLLDTGVGVVIAMILVALASPIADLASGGELDPDLVRLATLGMLCTTADGTTGAMLMLAERTHLRAWLMATTNLARVVGVLVAVEIGGAEAVLTAYVLASAAGAALQGVIAWRIGWRGWRDGDDDSGDRVGLRALANFGVHTSVGNSLFSARDLLFPVLLGSLSGPAAVGVFRAAMFPVFLGGVASGPIRLLLLPEQAKLAAQRRYADLWHSIRLHMIGAAAIGVPAAVIGFFVLPWLIPAIFSEKFSGAVDPARILLIAAVWQLMLGWGKSLLVALGRPQIRTLVSGVSLVVTVAFLALLGGSGSKGAALAYTLAALTTGSIWLFLAHHLLRGTARDVEVAAR